MGWIKVIGELLPIVSSILAILNRKKAEKLEKVITVVTEGVEIANIIQNAKKDANLTPEEKVKITKQAIKDGAEALGVNDFIAEKVKPYGDKLKAEFEAKADKFISKLIANK